MAQDLPRSLFVGSVNVKIEGDARAVIEKEIDNLNANQKYLSSLVVKMNLYFPIIEKILAEEGIPDEFKYLCVQESAFNSEALSSSNAVGFWQFKRETATEVGMRVDGVVDERKHIAAATKGAAVYLSRNNLILKNWVSTLLSYRLGLGAVRRMTDIDWAYKNEVTVNSSTDWYVLRFLAYRYFMEKQYKLSKNNPTATYLFEYNNSRGKNLTDIAQELEIPLSDVVMNNPWLKSSTVPDDKDYIVYLPVSNEQYLDLKIKNNQKKFSEDQVAISQDLGFPVLVRLTQVYNSNEPIFYEINGKKGILAVQGDTPESVAARAGINLKRFLKFNDIDENDRIIPNEVYYLKKKDSRAVVAYHTVLGYETMWKISQMYGVQMEALLEKNRMTQIQRLQKGRLLWLIETRPEGQSIEYVQSPDDKPYVVPQEPVVVKKTPVNQPVNVKTVPQNTQPEITVFETKTDNNATASKNSVVINETRPTTISTPIETVKTPTVASPQPSNMSVSSKPASTTVYSPPPATAYLSKKNSKTVKSHVVEPKQTFFSISRLYNMSVDELYSLNDMYSGSPLRIGQTIRVYQSSSSPVTGAIKEGEVVTAIYTYPAENQPPPNSTTTTTIVREVVTTSPVSTTSTPVAIPNTTTSTTVYQPTVTNNPTTVYTPTPPINKPFTPAPANTKPNYKIIHTIQAGETIFRVSKLYGVSVDEIKSWNNLSINTVEIGQELVVLGGNTKPTTTTVQTPPTTKIYTAPTTHSNTQYHTLQAGETVFRVSKLYGVTVDDIVKWNNIKGFAVSVGQRLVVKK
ncbi:MAG: LysM peptidoglycan-binding domain-containing protein [Arcicella sp.]|nr:LysM peptidoglycan-binding domain-containing protein [Arcicella sp.]